MNFKGRTEFINTLFDDLKAEYLVAGLPEQQSSPDKILIACDGALRRKWSTDIRYAGMESFENGDETLTIHLNRTGVYDALPEALFHDDSGKRNASGEEMALDSRRLKAEEKQVRLFFRPFEHEFFLQNVRVAIQESRELEQFYYEFLDGLIPGFWKTDQKIPSHYTAKLIKLLPLVHKISGNYELTARCLSEILGEMVHIELMEGQRAEPEDMPRNERSPVFSLGRLKLGDDTVLGHQVAGFFGTLRVKIGPLKNSAVSLFFKDGPADRLLNCFYGYFVPVELDVETMVLPEKTQSRIKLQPEFATGQSFLGYNTIL
jgi:hypothetical protein